MKAEDLAHGIWYYCANNHDDCKYFMLLEHHRDKHTYSAIHYLIRGIDGKKYWALYSIGRKIREMTPE